MLVPLRPSNEALLRARVPGAQDQRGCPSILTWGLCEQERWLPTLSHSLGGFEMQLCLHSFEHKELQERLVGNIALVGQCFELIQKRFW